MDYPQITQIRKEMNQVDGLLVPFQNWTSGLTEKRERAAALPFDVRWGFAPPNDAIVPRGYAPSFGA